MAFAALSHLFYFIGGEYISMGVFGLERGTAHQCAQLGALVWDYNRCCAYCKWDFVSIHLSIISSRVSLASSASPGGVAARRTNPLGRKPEQFVAAATQGHAKGPGPWRLPIFCQAFFLKKGLENTKSFFSFLLRILYKKDLCSLSFP
jgi:hypothetical protein